ncbi:Solute carrier family 22 member 1 [Chionoecetes opilio]|uniref:Solute carrier family 22 member 1 n=1 Tax=Chionoecetes opilio TaxID=41210 RepID=A0A8J4YJM3_CHIOP|nr:Solute carrier family 22 member 1 [Chionoecetes opilio]
MQLPNHVFSGAFTVPVVPHTCLAVAPDDDVTNTTTITAADTTTTTTVDGLPTPISTNYTFHLANDTFNDEYFDLVCDRRFLRGLYNSVYYFGAFVGSPLSGWMSDTFGRRKVFVLSSIMYAILANIIPWIPNLNAILVLRFFLGSIQPATVQSGYTLVMEVFEERWRSTAGIVVFLPWCLGMMLLGGVCSAVKHWRWQSCYLSLPTLVLLLMMGKLDESPRWLIVRGRYSEALNVLRKAARWNNTSLPPTKELLAVMEDIREKSADSSSRKREGKCRMVWRVLDSFINLLSVFFLFSPLRTGYGRVVMTLALLGKLTLCACYQIIYLHSSELFPTEVRTLGMANASMMARISAVFASFLVSALPSTWSAAPPIIFGCACLIASALTLMLPETRGAALYDTVAALEATGLSENEAAEKMDLLEVNDDMKITITPTKTNTITSASTTTRRCSGDDDEG